MYYAFILNADHHPGNYLFMKNGRLWLSTRMLQALWPRGAGPLMLLAEKEWRLRILAHPGKRCERRFAASTEDDAALPDYLQMMDESLRLERVEPSTNSGPIRIFGDEA